MTDHDLDDAYRMQDLYRTDQSYGPRRSSGAHSATWFTIILIHYAHRIPVQPLHQGSICPIIRIYIGKSGNADLFHLSAAKSHGRRQSPASSVSWPACCVPWPASPSWPGVGISASPTWSQSSSMRMPRWWYLTPQVAPEWAGRIDMESEKIAMKQNTGLIEIDSQMRTKKKQEIRSLNKECISATWSQSRSMRMPGGYWWYLTAYVFLSKVRRGRRHSYYYYCNSKKTSTINIAAHYIVRKAGYHRASRGKWSTLQAVLTFLRA